MKIAILYYTRGGTTKQMAEVIAEGMAKVEGVETGVFSLEEADVEFVKDSKCVVLGTPTYYASFAGAVKMWFEEKSRAFGLAGKIGGAFATEDYLHGGGDLALQAVLDHMMVVGMLAYSGGGSFGVPVIHLGPVAIKGRQDEARDAFVTYGERMAKKTVEIFA